jgi:phosphoglycerate dehydrogenase-like enzyme
LWFRICDFFNIFPIMLTIWTNARLPDTSIERLRAGVAPDRLIVSENLTSNLGTTAADPLLAEADIALGQPDPQQLLKPLKLKWIQLTSAGYTRYDRADLRESLSGRGIILTNSSSVFDEPCAEHILAFMLAHDRAIPQSLQNQLRQKAWPIRDFRMRTRLLLGQSVLMLGYGAIVRRLIELLEPLHMKIVAVRQKPRGNEPVSVYGISDLARLLPEADHVVDCLPDSKSTNQFMNAARFGAMKPSAVFYNIGRGTTVDQDALLASLKNKQIAAAYLDVTEPEPLPPEHPLWSAPNCYITPHIGGGHIDEFDRVVDHFLTNLRAFQANGTMRNRIV